LTAKAIKHLRFYLDEFRPKHSHAACHTPVFYSPHHGQPTALSVDTVAAVLRQGARTARTDCP
jgi:integrase/recombinase XerD